MPDKASPAKPIHPPAILRFAERAASRLPKCIIILGFAMGGSTNIDVADGHLELDLPEYIITFNPGFFPICLIFRQDTLSEDFRVCEALVASALSFTPPFPISTQCPSPDLGTTATRTSSTSSAHSLTKPPPTPEPTKHKSKLGSLLRKKSTPPSMPEEQAQTKEMIMKYREMTSEEADAYLENKKRGLG
ncbi:hypothetical protein EK21DRAFT_93329 [Setomelanomma holmii]|uniref:Uncharacterized protein n=1 Tax=Setomelanomma holmii TaxID=210430 RepID=A0A9P4H132_9PLEO|nr:hypothetical protein EK21DRAFT_93329 [Setomelanomma holmii]